MDKIKDFSAYDIDYIIKQFSTDIYNGLTEEEAKQRLKTYGYNRLIELNKTNFFKLLIKQFTNPMSFLLLIASIISFIFEEWVDGIAIFIVLIINTIIGFVMEWQANKSMEALKKLAITESKVIREGKLKNIPSDFLVPGDLIFIEAGDIVTADARLIEVNQLKINESTLTGESLAIDKNIKKIKKNSPLAERTNMLFKGTSVVKGNGKAIIVATGMDTELGHISKLVQFAQQSATPLEKKLNSFSQKLLLISLIIVLIIFFIGLLNGNNWIDMVKTAIAISVATIPEGLPIVATLTLSQGVLKMAKQNVIIKKLSSVETLGGTTVICSDKTGTLTQNKIEVSIIHISNDIIEISSNRLEIQSYKTSKLFNSQTFQNLLKIATLCNSANFSKKSGNEISFGDPLEIGLLKFVYLFNIDIDLLRKKYIKVDEHPFNSNDKVMATKHLVNDSYWVGAKGAFEELIKYCTKFDDNGKIVDLNTQIKTEWYQHNENLAKKGLKVLAFAWKESNKDDSLFSNLIFTGIIGFIDPPAKGVLEAIKKCKKAGIKIKMITGDHPATALNIAEKLKLVDTEHKNVILGQNMPKYELLDEKTKEKWLNTSVFARVNPEQKLDLVKLLQEKNNIVAMTGDGVNDAPALKKSDIGIAMGKKGTQVAQDAADMILKDDSFVSIVSAIKYGRIIYNNLRQFIIYLLSCNLSELIIISTITILNLPFQLLPLQILFINLISDVFPALALGFSKGDKNIMNFPPRNPNENLITKKHWFAIWTYAITLSFFTMLSLFFSHTLLHPNESWNSILNNNIIFISLIISQLLHVFNLPSIESSFLNNEIIKNKYIWYALSLCFLLIILIFNVEFISNALALKLISVYDWLIIISFSILFVLSVRIIKKLKIIT